MINPKSAISNYTVFISPSSFEKLPERRYFKRCDLDILHVPDRDLKIASDLSRTVEAPVSSPSVNAHGTQAATSLVTALE